MIYVVWMAGSGDGWASLRERYTVWTAVIMSLVAFVAILIACFFKDMTTAEKIVTVLVSFVGTPLGYLFGYSTTKSAEVSAKEDISILREQISQTNGAIEKLRQARQTDQEIISDLKVALERTRKL